MSMMNCTSNSCEETASRMVGACFMALVTFMAIFGNIFIITVILQSQNLRSKLCYFFVLNLAFTDLISALVILPISITVFILGYWPWSLQVCIINGCLNSLLVFASTLNLCLISIERFYAIRFTMHHAAHMTLPRTLLAIGTSWLCSAILASLPFSGLTSYEFRQNKSNCSYSLETVGYEKLFLVLVTVLCFLMPGCVIIVMYSGIYRVAHQLSTQVHPTPPQNQCWGNRPNITVSHIEQQQKEQTCDANANEKIEPKYTSIQIPNIKAAKSFILIILSYMLLWGPYFGLHMYGAIHGVLPSAHYLEVLVTWLGYSSFAVNPLIYGWMNLCIRDEVVICLKRLLFCFKNTEDSDTNCPASVPEDFYEFLHRTRDNDDTLKTNEIKLKTKSKSQYVDIDVTDTIKEPYF